MAKHDFCSTLYAAWHRLWAGITLGKLFWIFLGAAITSFGLYNIHRQVDITEGGVLGMMLFVNHWFGIPSSQATPILDIACYALAFRYLGARFIKISVISTLSVSGCFWLWEQRPPMLPDLSEMPLAAAVFGALFVGVGVGLSVLAGGAPGGDDALAMSLGHLTRLPLQWIYLASALLVLLLSLSYIPLSRIAWSLLTVLISGQLIGLMQRLPFLKEPEAAG